MTTISGWGGRIRGLFADNKGPWGQSGGDGGGDPPGDEGPGGPWGETPRRGRRTNGAGNFSALEE